MISMGGEGTDGGHVTVASEVMGQATALRDAEGDANQHQSRCANERVAWTQEPRDEFVQPAKQAGGLVIGLLKAPPHGGLETGRQIGGRPGVAQEAAQALIIRRGRVHININVGFIVFITRRTDNQR